MATGQAAPTGDDHTTAVTNSQTLKLLAAIIPALVLLVGAATAWLNSVATANQVANKEAMTALVKEIMAGQPKEAEKTVQAVKEAKPAPAAPPIVVVPTAAPAQTNPLLTLPPEVAAKYLAEYLKTQQDKKQP